MSSKPTDPRGTSAPVWREEVLAEAAQLEFTLLSLRPPADPAHATEIQAALASARKAATERRRGWFRRLQMRTSGAEIERAWGAIDTAHEALLRIAPDTYRVGQLPRIEHRVRECLATQDDRRTRFEAIQHSAPITPANREVILVAFHGANSERRRNHARVRNFRNMIHLCGIVLTVVALGLGLLGFARPDLALLCFQPSGQAVCPTRVVATDLEAPVTGQPVPLQPWQVQVQDFLTRHAATKWDVILIELIGLIAAALAGASAVRRLQGSSMPYGVAIAVAFLKLPSGALTATLGLLLIRADFIPGLSALDTPAQIIGWAIVLGYAQELFTRFVDQRAQSVLSSGGAAAGTPGAAPANP